MHHQNYCILNKQYSAEEYEKLVPQIIENMIEAGEYGEFFPIRRSPFGYNKTMSQIFYPMSRKEVVAKGWEWDDYEPEFEKVETVAAADLPDNIKDVDDLILEKGIICEVSGKPFKITQSELKFYRTQGLPLPRMHWLERYKSRLNKRNPRRFWDRKCDKCEKDIRSSYSPDRPEKVYCEECYMEEVV